MEKLIELLNEYEEEIKKSEGDYRYYFNLSYNKQYIECRNANNGQFLSTNEFRIFICSKSYGFIQRLVDNDKIDLMKLKKGIEDNKFYCAKWGKTTNMLLMLLSIQDNPIEFLISILK